MFPVSDCVLFLFRFTRNASSRAPSKLMRSLLYSEQVRNTFTMAGSIRDFPGFCVYRHASCSCMISPVQKSLFCLLLIRLEPLFHQCREEESHYCTQFFPTMLASELSSELFLYSFFRGSLLPSFLCLLSSSSTVSSLLQVMLVCFVFCSELCRRSSSTSSLPPNPGSCPCICQVM